MARLHDNEEVCEGQDRRRGRDSRGYRRDVRLRSHDWSATPCGHPDCRAGPSPKTWYGMPAHAKDGKVVCFFRSAEKFKERYVTLGFKTQPDSTTGTCGRSLTRSRS